MDAKSITITVVLLLMMTLSSTEGIRYRRSRHGRRSRARDPYGGYLADPGSSISREDTAETGREPRWTHYPHHQPSSLSQSSSMTGGDVKQHRRGLYDDDYNNNNGAFVGSTGGVGANDRNARDETNNKEPINEVNLSDYQTSAYQNTSNPSNTTSDTNTTLGAIQPVTNSTSDNTTTATTSSPASGNSTANNNNTTSLTVPPSSGGLTKQQQSSQQSPYHRHQQQSHRHNNHHHDREHKPDTYHVDTNKYYRKKPTAFKNNAVYFEVGPEYSFDKRPQPDEYKLHLYDPKRKHSKKFNPRVLDLHYESRGDRLNTTSLTRPRPYSFERRRPKTMLPPAAAMTASEEMEEQARRGAAQEGGARQPPPKNGSAAMMMMTSAQRPIKLNRMHRV